MKRNDNIWQSSRVMPSGDLIYLPKLFTLKPLGYEIELHAILFLGSPEPAIVKEAIETGVNVKQYSTPRLKKIPQGSFFFKNSRGQWQLIICRDGLPDVVEIIDGRQDFLHDEHPLINLSLAFATYWDEGDSIGSSAKFSIGDSVQILADNTVGKIDKVQIVAGEPRYSVLTGGGIIHVFESEITRLAMMPGDSTTWISNRPVSAESIALTITATKLKDPLTDVIYSFESSRTLFRPYQFRPVLKMLNGTSNRLLIADEVGLGKTIEAGLIWSELEFRSPLETVLIVCPSVLKRKWQSEMKNRFDRDVKELSNLVLDEWIQSLEKGRPDKLIAIASLEGLRTSKYLEKLRELSPQLDLVIVDEAHYLRNKGNRSNELGQYLSEWAEAMIFLSATPLNLGTADLFNLLNLLDSTQFFDKATFEQQIEPNTHINNVAKRLSQLDINPRELIPILDKIKSSATGGSLTNRSDFSRLRELLQKDRLTRKDISDAKRHLAELNTLASIFTRTRKSETPEKRAVREPISVHVEWTAQEREIYDGIRQFLVNRARTQGKIPGFQMQVPLRQASSCLPAVIELMKEDKYGLEEDDDYFLIDEESTNEDQPSIQELINIFGRIPALKSDSKYDAFVEGLRNARTHGTEQALIFSFFTRTILYLEHRLLKDGFKVKVMYGKTKPDERQRIMKQFRDGEFELLLCSEVGSEGLDFEFCHLLVNYDLPWNPMRVEQRIGRLDRFGQKSDKIFILNMRIPGTIEDDIFMRLFDRIGVFEDSIGELEPILREDLRNITSVLLRPSLTEKERDQEIQRFGVAVENKRNDLDDLASHKNLVAGIDSFLIEGFDEHTPGRGRFIGRQEIIRVVTLYLQKMGGSIRQIAENRWQLTGSTSIAAAIREQTRFNSSGTSVGVSTLARELDGRKPGLLATFDPEVAAKENLELISVRNPLLRCVKDDLVSNSGLWSRFGSVVVHQNKSPDSPSTNKYLVGIHLARSQGIRPSLELWTTTYDLENRMIIDGPGDELLQAFASNTFKDNDNLYSLDGLKRANEIIENEVAIRQKIGKERLAQDNAAILEERRMAKILSLSNKISIAEQRLATTLKEKRDTRVINMNQTKVTQLKRELAHCKNTSDESLTSLTVEAIAYIYLEM